MSLCEVTPEKPEEIIKEYSEKWVYLDHIIGNSIISMIN